MKDITECKANLIEKLSATFGIETLLCKILIDNGVDTEQKAEYFFNGSYDTMVSPFAYQNMEIAVDNIKDAIRSNKKIVIYGDYDCDGIGAVSILYKGLKEVGANIEFFVPVRSEDGYGLSIDALSRLISEFNPYLIITVDCGITSLKESEFLKENDVNLIITDHHMPSESLPNAICVNPHFNPELTQLSGAGVALRLLEGIAGKEIAKNYVDICAISTIADVVTLQNDNRVIAREGLKMLSTRSLRYCFKVMLQKSNPKYKVGDSVSVNDVGFKIAPRLNASGRLSSAYKSIQLLVSEDVNEINLIIDELEQENRKRQEICKDLIQIAEEKMKVYDLVKNFVIVLKDEKFDPGVIGIVASKLAEKYDRPVILLSDFQGRLKGSCRSIKGVNITMMLTACKQSLQKFGGHAMAAGISLEKENFEQFFDSVMIYSESNIDVGMMSDTFDNTFIKDLNEVNQKFISDLKKFEPFGQGNPFPVFTSRVKALEFKRLGEHSHFMCSFGKECNLMAFGVESSIGQLLSESEKDIFYTIEQDEYKNKLFAKATLKKFRLINICNDKFNDYVSFLKLERCVSYFNIDYQSGQQCDIISKNECHNNVIATLDCGENSVQCGEKYNYGMEDAPFPKKSMYFGHLVIVFDDESQKMAQLKYPNYKVALHYLNKSAPYNTVLRSPEDAFDFGHFKLIEVYSNSDKIVENLQRSFSLATVIKQEINVRNCENKREAMKMASNFALYDLQDSLLGKVKLNRHIVLNVYVYLKRWVTQSELPIHDNKIVSRLCMHDKSITREQAILSILVLSELSLLIFDGKFRCLKNEKTELTNSKIYRLFCSES